MMAGLGGGATSSAAAAGAGRAAPAPEQMVERRARPQKEKALNCPRCNSTNTKFCYYNNYSLTQPRYFCKTCRRYWTEGGSLRNVPVGGGSRKNKRSSSSSSSSSPSSFSSAPPTSFSTTTTTTVATTATTVAAATTSSTKNLVTTHDVSLSSPSHNIKFTQSLQDLNLAFPYHGIPPPPPHHHHHHHDHHHHQYTADHLFQNSSCSTTSSTSSTSNITSGNSRSNPYIAGNSPIVGAFSAMDLLRTGMSSSRGGVVGSYVPMSMPLHEYPSGLGFLHDFRPPTTLGMFPLDHGVGGEDHHGGEVASTVGGAANYESSSLPESRLLFPFEDLKPAAGPPVPSSNSGELDHSRMQSGDPPGFWNGIMHGGGGGGGGGSW